MCLKLGALWRPHIRAVPQTGSGKTTGGSDHAANRALLATDDLGTTKTGQRALRMIEVDTPPRMVRRTGP